MMMSRDSPIEILRFAPPLHAPAQRFAERHARCFGHILICAALLRDKNNQYNKRTRNSAPAILVKTIFADND